MLYILVFNNSVLLCFGYVDKGITKRIVTLPCSYTSKYSLFLQGNNTSAWQNYPTCNEINLSSIQLCWYDSNGRGWWFSIGF